MAAAALIGRSAGAAAWFKNTKGAAPAAGPSARGRPGRQHRPVPCPSLRGAGACEHQPPAVRLGSKLGFGVQASSVPGAPRGVPARPEAGQGPGPSPDSPAEGECRVCLPRAPAPLSLEGWESPGLPVRAGSPLRRAGVGSPGSVLSVKPKLQQGKAWAHSGSN